MLDLANKIFTGYANPAYQVVREVLERPFPVTDLSVRLAGNIVLSYADIQAYKERLNSEIPGLWYETDLTVTPAGTRAYESTRTVYRNGQTHETPVQITEQLVTVSLSLVVCGISMCGVSDPDSPTSAYAQAFKRACANHGLGSYMYNFDKIQKHQVLLDQDGQLVTDPLSIAIYHYDSHGLPVPPDAREYVAGLSNELVFNPDTFYDYSPKRQAPAAKPTSTPTPATRPAPNTDQQPAGLQGVTEKQYASLHYNGRGFTHDEIAIIGRNGWAKEIIDARMQKASLQDLREQYGLNPGSTAKPAAAARAWNTRR